jgi:GNAT superfamily N-acetyltransferase
VSTATFRVAEVADEGAIRELMVLSARGLFPLFYDAAETESALRHVPVLDLMLVADGTYFVGDSGGELVACGGWSRRDRLYTGSGDAAGDDRLLDPATEPARVRAMFVHPEHTRRGLGTRILELCEAAAKAEGFTTLSLMATLAGIPLYERYGFELIEHVDLPMPDGMTIGGARMEKAID